MRYPRDNAVSRVEKAGENKVACANATMLANLGLPIAVAANGTGTGAAVGCGCTCHNLVVADRVPSNMQSLLWMTRMVVLSKATW